jgi:lipopolysaccharide/colanic/teichoic acid biosynthesis glycosyltransferase
LTCFAHPFTRALPQLQFTEASQQTTQQERKDIMELPDRGLDASNVTASHWFNHIFLATGHPVPNQNLPIDIPSASTWTLSNSKRLLDLFTALLVLALLALPMLIIALCVRLTSKGPAFFVQKRVGRGGRLFGIYKFRSMADGSSTGPGLTRGGDRRITAVGRWIRRFKLDELPQFYNVLRGEMSLVGPRPKLPIYEPITNMPYRPGITGAATLAFRNEEDILSGVHASQVEHFYSKQIKPLKAQIDLQYMSHATPWSDLRMIAATFLACLAPEPIQAPESDQGRQPGGDSMPA